MGFNELKGVVRGSLGERKRHRRNGCKGSEAGKAGNFQECESSQGVVGLEQRETGRGWNEMRTLRGQRSAPTEL